MKGIRFFIVMLMLGAGPAFGQARRLQVSLFGGASPVFAYGSAADYAAGDNDFPVTPAHTPGHGGAAIAYYLTGRLGFELRGEYIMATPLILTDPSDGDSVSVDSGGHLAAALNLIWEPFAGRLRPYLVAGGGADRLFAETVSTTSRYGYEVAFGRPDKPLNAFVNAGAGVRWLAFSSVGIELDLRYRRLLSRPDRVSGLTAAAGLFLRF